MVMIEDLDKAYSNSLLFFREHKHLLNQDRERDAIDLIKARNAHIGTIEAQMILGKLRAVGDKFL